MMKSTLFACMVLFALAQTKAQSLTGTYTGKTEDGEVLTLRLEEHSDKTISGSLTDSGNVSRLSGRIDGSGAAGTATVPEYGQPVRFVLRRNGQHQITMTVSAGGETMPPQVFTRIGAASPSAAAPGIPKVPQPPVAREAKGKPDGVRINGVAVLADLLRTYEQRYRLRVIPGDYWYDRRSGAWGITGGPALGFAPPGLELGGKLRADASNGDTGIFVNGRELHRVDIALLQQITIVIPGRYWLNANGDYGFEGGPALGNFVALIQAATTPTRREGILSSYDKTGVAVIGGEVLMR